MVPGHRSAARWEMVFRPGFDLDANDVPYVAYQDLSANNVGNCFTYNGSNWIRVGPVPYSGVSPGVWNDLRVDRYNGNVYVLWNGFSSNSQRSTVSHWNGSAWTDLGNGPVTSDKVWFDQSLAIGLFGKVYVALAAGAASSQTQLDVYEYSGSSWFNIGSDIAGGIAEDIAMEANEAGCSHDRIQRPLYFQRGFSGEL